MKTLFSNLFLCLIGLLTFLMSCEKWNYARINFFSIKIEKIEKANIGEYHIKSSLRNLDSEKVDLVQLGHCWSSTNQLPDLSDFHTILTPNSIYQDSLFNDTIKGVEFSRTYFVRGYIIAIKNDFLDTFYSEEPNFFPTDDLIVITDENIEVSSDSILVRGLVRIGNVTNVTVSFGHCWSSDPNPVFNPNGEGCTRYSQVIDGDILFESSIGPIETNQMYYLRSYAIVNGNPPVYGNIITYLNESRWKQLQNIPAEPRAWAFSFAIDDFAYVGTGHARNFILEEERTIVGCYDDIWRYSPQRNEWVNLGKFPGGERAGTVSLTIDRMAYVGLGFSCSIDPRTNKLKHYKDFFSFDPATNTWEKLPDFPGAPRSMATGFAIEDTIYIGMGRVADIISFFVSDFWKYSIADRKWDPIEALPGKAKSGAYGFTLNGKGYVAGGDDTGAANILDYNSTKEVYEYNPATGKWSQSPFDLTDGLSFGSVVTLQAQNRVYVVSGILNNILTLDEILEFNPSEGWTPVANIESGIRGLSTAFGLDGRIYLSTGASFEIAGIIGGQVFFLNDLWVFNL